MFKQLNAHASQALAPAKGFARALTAHKHAHNPVTARLVKAAKSPGGGEVGKIERMFLQHPELDSNALDHDGRSLCHLAAANGDIPLLKALHARGGALDSTGSHDFGASVMQSAVGACTRGAGCSRGFEVVSWLRAQGVVAEWNQTAEELASAAAGGELEVVMELVGELRVDPDLVDYDGRTALCTLLPNSERRPSRAILPRSGACACR